MGKAILSEGNSAVEFQSEEVLKLKSAILEKFENKKTFKLVELIEEITTNILTEMQKEQIVIHFLFKILKSMEKENLIKVENGIISS